ncbi:MAG TPA: type II toxin-antitoxin system VapC family toxin [Herpetosiphonaceae bacterium]
MSNLVLIDTDVLIDVARKVPDAITSSQHAAKHASLAVSAVTQMELFVGCRNKAELRKVERFLAQFTVVSITEQMSDTAVDLVRQYRLSHGLLIADALVAASALILNQPLLTKNQRDYRFITGLNLLPYPYP